MARPSISITVLPAYSGLSVTGSRCSKYRRDVAPSDTSAPENCILRNVAPTRACFVLIRGAMERHTRAVSTEMLGGTDRGACSSGQSRENALPYVKVEAGLTRDDEKCSIGRLPRRS